MRENTIKEAISELEHGIEIGNIIFQMPEDEHILTILKLALKKEVPKKLKIIEMSRYEDGEPFDNLACGNCETIFIPNIEWEDLYDEEKIKNIIEKENIEENEWAYCCKYGQRLNWC